MRNIVNNMIKSVNKHFIAVFVVSSLLIMTFIPAFTFAEEVQINEEKTDSISIGVDVKRDYSTLLSALFGAVDKPVDATAFEFTKNLDQYRNRVARQIEQNTILLNVIEGLDKFDEYSEEIVELRGLIENEKVTIVPIIENDAYLSKSVKYKYNLYNNFVDRMLAKVSGDPVAELNALGDEVFRTYLKMEKFYLQLRQ